jgi:hypothetical protein
MSDKDKSSSPYMVPPREDWKSVAQSRAEGWKTIGDLRYEYHQDYGVIKRRVRILQAQLIGDLQAAGFSKALSEILVANHFIGESRRGTRTRVLMVSPDAQRWLSPSKTPSLTDADRTQQWLTQQVQTFRDQIVTEMRQAGYSETEASQLLNQCLDSHRSRSKGSTPQR